MKRAFLTGICWLTMAGSAGALLAAQPLLGGHAGAPASIHIVNPESTGVTWSYLIDGQVQSLQAGYSQQIDSACTIAFDRGGGLGAAKYSLSGGTYTFTQADGHWVLVHTDTPAVVAAAEVGAVDEGTNSGPPLPAVGHEAAGASSVLFDGKTMNGWHLRDPDGPNYWSVKGGELVAKAEGKFFGKNLVTDSRYGDFELRLEFLLEDGANSGVYLRGLYEVQLYDDNWNTVPPNQRCGAIWHQVAPSESAYLGPGKWNTLKVKMVGQHICVTMNDKRILDDAVPSGPTDGVQSLSIKEGDPGPIMLQCTPMASTAPASGGAVRFRNISIIALGGAGDPAAPPVDTVQSPNSPPPVLSEEDKRMFWAMYRDAGLDKATLKAVSDDWKSKTSPERKAEYDKFMKQVEEMRQAANKPARQTDDLP